MDNFDGDDPEWGNEYQKLANSYFEHVSESPSSVRINDDIVLQFREGESTVPRRREH